MDKLNVTVPLYKNNTLFFYKFWLRNFHISSCNSSPIRYQAFCPVVGEEWVTGFVVLKTCICNLEDETENRVIPAKWTVSKRERKKAGLANLLLVISSSFENWLHKPFPPVWCFLWRFPHINSFHWVSLCFPTVGLIWPAFEGPWLSDAFSYHLASSSVAVEAEMHRKVWNKWPKKKGGRRIITTLKIQLWIYFFKKEIPSI